MYVLSIIDLVFFKDQAKKNGKQKIKRYLCKCQWFQIDLKHPNPKQMKKDPCKRSLHCPMNQPWVALNFWPRRYIIKIGNPSWFFLIDSLWVVSSLSTVRNSATLNFRLLPIRHYRQSLPSLLLTTSPLPLPPPTLFIINGVLTKFLSKDLHLRP